MTLGEKYTIFDNDVDSYIYDFSEECYKDEGYETPEECRDALYDDDWFIQDWLDQADEDFADWLTKECQLPQIEGTYLFLGSNMGWRQVSGHAIGAVSSGEDIINTLHGNYDYTAKVYWTGGTHFFEATVWHHDAPTGEHYYIVPQCWIEEAMAESKDICETANSLAEEYDEVYEFLHGEEREEMAAQG